MQTERFGHYGVERSAGQLIHNGRRAAFAAIRAPGDEAQAASAMPGTLDGAVFASEAAL